MRSFAIAGMVCWLVVAGGDAALVSAQEDAQRWIPPQSNAVSRVRVGELLNSRFGQRRRWVEEYRDAYAAGLVAAPPSVLEFIRATEFRPYAGATTPVYSIFTMRVDVNMAEIARHEMSKVDRIGDTVVVHSQRGSYFARLGPRILAALQPADRQLLSRWVRFGAEASAPGFSPYAREVLEGEKSAQVVVALDLAEMADAEFLAKWLAVSPAVKRHGGDVAKLTEQFQTLRGMRVAVSVTDDIVGRLQLDFSQPVAADAALMKGLLLEWLDEAGARVDNLVSADAKVDDKSFVLSSQLEEQAFRRILSLIQTPHPSEQGGERAPNGAQTANVIASRRYYDAVVAAVRDLGNRNRRAADYEKTALWHEQFAVRIENLSTVGVDPDLAQWGYQVSSQLRALAYSLRGVPVEIDRLSRAIRYDVRTFHRRIGTTEWGGIFRPEWFAMESNLQDVRAAQQETILKDQDNREQIWTMLEEDRQAIVAKMKERFGVDFDQR